MVVYSKDELKNALKKGERHIEIQGNYAEELFKSIISILWQNLLKQIGLAHCHWFRNQYVPL